MKRPFFLLLFIALTPAVCMAMGSETGNGGNVILCTNGSGVVTSITLMDYYEGEMIRQIKRDLGPSSLSYQEKIELALKRLDPLSPRRAQLYRSYVSSFLSESNFIPNANLIPIVDYELLALGPNCTAKQTAIQRTPVYQEDKRYLIDKDIWDLLDNDNKAGLILHEAIYREAIALGQTDSKNARYFNSYLTSDKLLEFKSQIEFAPVMIRVQFTPIEISDLDFSSLSFYPNGAIESGYAQQGSLIVNGKKETIEKGDIHFFESGQIDEVKLSGKHPFVLAGNNIEFGPGKYSFYEDGSLHSFEPDMGDSNPTVFKSALFEIHLCNGPMTFYPNGMVSSALILSGAASAAHGELELAAPASRCFEADIDQSGQIRKGTLKDSISYSIGGVPHQVFGPFELDSNGEMLAVKSKDLFHVGDFDLRFSVDSNDSISFYPSGHIKSGTLYQEAVLKDTRGRSNVYFRGPVQFSENGRVLTGDLDNRFSSDLISLHAISRTQFEDGVKFCDLALSKEILSQMPLQCNEFDYTDGYRFSEELSNNTDDIFNYKWDLYTRCSNGSAVGSLINVRFPSSGRQFEIDVHYPSSADFALPSGIPSVLFEKDLINSPKDSLGNLIPDQILIKGIIIQIPDHFGKSVPLLNSNNDPTKFTIDMESYVDCLKQKLF